MCVCCRVRRNAGKSGNVVLHLFFYYCFKPIFCMRFVQVFVQSLGLLVGFCLEVGVKYRCCYFITEVKRFFNRRRITENFWPEVNWKISNFLKFLKLKSSKKNEQEIFSKSKRCSRMCMNLRIWAAYKHVLINYYLTPL